MYARISPDVAPSFSTTCCNMASSFGGGLFKDDSLIMIIDDNFDSGGVHFEALAKRTRLTHKYPAALA